MTKSSPNQVPQFAPVDTRTTDRWLLLYLKFIGAAAILAFGAALMPEQWIVEFSETLGFDPFPHSPLTFYLARNLSLLYGFVGITLWLVVQDLKRYRPLVYWLAIGTIVFGVLQGIVDALSGLPLGWTLSESLRTFTGGWVLFFLDRHATRSLRQ